MTAHRLLVAITFILFSLSNMSFASGDGEWNDPTEGKAFFPWVWDDQLKPTIVQGFDETGARIIVGGLMASAAAGTQDDKLFEYTQNHHIMSDSWEQLGGFLGSGGPGVVLALSQLWWDQPGGLQSFRAMLLTTVTHVTLAASINRQRPTGDRGWSWPSGHTSNAFAIATSMAYSYGPWVGTASYGVATFIAASRISAQVHWLSDVVAAAALGIYWGRASALVTESQKKNTTMIYPVPIDGGLLVQFSKDF
ncbi:phosphatase PAP2 family protein [Bdellovibrio sp. HCB185ZH]|uniref:phosphatase PAP2 family protein n=1 Tax=Bdellovibrio sp. HCB185ZH TaxID=3394235 RepID=UPI0039A78418